MMRTLEMFRKQGFEIEVVERWIAGARIKKDLFGIIDALAISGDRTVGVQVCGADFAPHVAKITGPGAQAARQWLQNGRELVLIGWTPQNRRKGHFRPKYEARERWFTPQDFISDDFLN
jgi:hypothetical protein